MTRDRIECPVDNFCRSVFQEDKFFEVPFEHMDAMLEVRS